MDCYKCREELTEEEILYCEDVCFLCCAKEDIRDAYPVHPDNPCKV